jgi:hypothetical protein
MDERLSKMRKMYESGKSLRDVGREFGLTGSRVQQLFRENGIGRRERGSHTRPVTSAAVRETITRGYLGGVTRENLASANDLSVAEVNRVLRSELTKDEVDRRNRLQATGKSTARHWADWEMVAALKDCGYDIGAKFTANDYMAWREGQTPDYPSGPLFHTRRPEYAAGTGAASWNEWRKLAGLPISERSNSYEKFSDEDILLAIDAVAATVDKFPSLSEYEKYKPDGAPTAGAIRRRHGGRWGTVRETWSRQRANLARQEWEKEKVS